MQKINDSWTRVKQRDNENLIKYIVYLNQQIFFFEKKFRSIEKQKIIKLCDNVIIETKNLNYAMMNNKMINIVDV